MWQDLTGNNTKRIDEIIEKTFSNDQQHEVIVVSKKLVWKGIIGF